MSKYLKISLFIFCAFSCKLIFSQENNSSINWISWDEMMLKRVKDSIKKKVFIDFYTPWCGWCKRMDMSTFKDPLLINYIKKEYYTVKFNGETKDTIVFNNHQFVNSDPSYVKKKPKF